VSTNPTVSFDVKDEEWFVLGEPRRCNRSGQLLLHETDLAKISATDLQSALRRSCANYSADDEQVLVSDVPLTFFDRDSPVSAISFELLNNRLSLTVNLFLEEPALDTKDFPALTRRTLTPLLDRHRMTLLDCSMDDYSAAPFSAWTAKLGFATRSRMLGDLYAGGQEASLLWDAASMGVLSRETTGDLIRGGNAHLLIGTEEGHWLDVKSDHYDLSAERGKISLAQAVARFCNAEEGGLVVVGMDTKRIPGGERIRSLRPLVREQGICAKYRRVLDSRLFPPPDGLEIDAVNAPGDGILILIDIPPQPEELKPFLVHGAIVGNRVEGAFISIVRRRGEASIPITAPMIHSSLAAGRALLRGEWQRDGL